MKIAISIWNGFVSNVFDFADQLLVVDVEDQGEVCIGCSMMTELAIGKHIDQAWELTDDHVAEALGGLPASHVEF